MAAAPSSEPMDEDGAADESSATEETATSPSEEVGASMEEDGEEEDDAGPTATLWCSGDAPNSAQQQNFEGVWSLHTTAVAQSQRPIYEHVAPDGTPVFLFFVEQATPSGPCPRWVIGPEPAGDGMNGWAFSDSNASTPLEVFEPWRAWSRDTSEWGEARLAFSAKGSAIGRDSEYPSDDEALGTPGEGGGMGAKGGGGAKKKGKAKRKASKGGGAKKKGAGAGGGEAKSKGAAKAKAK